MGVAMTYELKMPILGFESTTQIRLERIDDVFSKIHSCDGDKPFEMVLINPFSLCKYEFTIPTAEEKLLDLDESRDERIEVYCVVVVQQPIENSVVNLLSPFVFNPTNATCVQITTLPVAEYPQFSQVKPLSAFLSDEILQSLKK